jgi:aminoglycoside phosphotransferase
MTIKLTATVKPTLIRFIFLRWGSKFSLLAESSELNPSTDITTIKAIRDPSAKISFSASPSTSLVRKILERNTLSPAPKKPIASPKLDLKTGSLNIDVINKISVSILLRRVSIADRGWMNNPTDAEVVIALERLNIPHARGPYSRIKNNNYAITDGENFFIKTSDSRDSLLLELETSLRLTSAPKLYVPELVEVGTKLSLITHYIPHQKATPENFTDAHIVSLLSQMSDINELKIEGYPVVRSLDSIMNLVSQRMRNPILKSTEIRLLNKLLEMFVLPYIEEHKYSNKLAHNDVKLPNILIKDEHEVVLIDYESIKPSPREMDLASLYQDLFQDGESHLYLQIEKAYKGKYGGINENLLNKSILFKNILTTTAAFQLKDRRIMESRLASLSESLKSKMPPTRLAPVEFSQSVLA